MARPDPVQASWPSVGGSAAAPPPTATGQWRPLLYFVIGQAGWFACVISAARGAPWIGVGLAIVLVTLHLWRVARPLEEFKLVASVVAMGAAWESTLIARGLLAYPGTTTVGGLAPLAVGIVGVIRSPVQHHVSMDETSAHAGRCSRIPRRADVVSRGGSAGRSAFHEAFGRRHDPGHWLGGAGTHGGRLVASVGWRAAGPG